MSFRVKYRGLEVVCDTLDEVDAVAERLLKSQVNQQQDAPKMQQLTTMVVDKHLLFISELSVNAKRLFKHLMAGDVVTDTDLRQALDIETNMALAGYVSGITKALKRAGFDSDKVFFKEMKWNEEGKREYTYSLDSIFKEQMRGYVR